MEIYELGDFPLSTGVTLPNAKLAYNTRGILSAAKDNAIVFESFLGAPLEALEIWIGKDRPLDPDKYFIIMPGPFGGGSSSSPSNTPSPFDRGAFPPVNIVDDVIAQHRLVTERFGIQELQLVVGWSTGSFRIYEWAVRFPHMVKRMASIAGSPDLRRGRNSGCAQSSRNQSDPTRRGITAFIWIDRQCRLERVARASGRR